MTTNGTSSAVPLLINNADYTTKDTFQVSSPLTEQNIHSAHSASVSDAHAAIEAAQAAFPTWAKTSPTERRNILHKAADIFESRAEELAKWMKEETGAKDDFIGFNLHVAPELLRDIAGRISGAVAGSVPWCEDPNMGAMVVKEPYGVVLAIAPW